MVIGSFFPYMLDFKKVVSILKKLLKIILIALTIDSVILNMDANSGLLRPVLRSKTAAMRS